MISTPPGFASLNRLSDLLAGRYIAIKSQYRLAEGDGYRAEIWELLDISTSTVIAADLMFYPPDGTCLFRDFALLPDGRWRDSYGARADRLGDLLPPELGQFSLQGRVGAIVDIGADGGFAWHSEMGDHDGS